MWDILTPSSGTSSVSIFSFKRKSKTIHLIDTPGFNDTTRSESEVLQEVAYWLSAAYGRSDAPTAIRFRLDGIVYLHSIADVRWSGSTRRSMNMLRSIVGPDSYNSIFLTTTFWDQVPREVGNEREAQIISDMDKWRQFVHTSPKASVRRHDQGYKTAMSIVDAILDRGAKYDLLIQKELARPGATIHDTTAGKEAHMLWERDIERFRQELRHVRAALEGSRQESDAMLATEVERLKSSISQGTNALKELDLPKEELERRWVSRNYHEVEMLQQKIADCQNTINDMIKRSETSLSRHPSSESPPPAYSQSPAASADRRLLEHEHYRKKELLAQKTAKLAARNMHISVASALFGGVSATVAILPLLPFLAACNIM
jgi:hypothetical protein